VTAIAGRRKRDTVIGAVVALSLVTAAAVMFVVGLTTLSNSQEGESVVIDERPREQFPVTPNAMLAVQDDDGDLAALVVLTLLPEGQGGSIVPVRVDADATSGFGERRRPLDAEFDPADVEALVVSVEEMLSISLQRAALVDPAVLEALIEPIGTVRAVLPPDAGEAATGEASGDVATGDVVTGDVATGDAVTGDAVTGDAVTSEAAAEAASNATGPQTLTPAQAVAVLTASGLDPDVAHANDVAVWEALGSAAPLMTPPEPVPTDDLGRPIAPDSVEDLLGRLFEGPVGVRDLAPSPRPPQGGNDLDPAVIDRRDSGLVFAQVSPALMSTPNPGLKMRVVAPYTIAQLDESGGPFESTTELMVEFIGKMLFSQNNVVSVESAPSGAPAVTLIEVVDPRLLEQVEESAGEIYGEAEVRLADTVLEGVDVEVTLGMSYLAREAGLSRSGGDESAGTSVPASRTVTVGGDG
jgi:hypothetical protein